jgi:16S rRNA (guanine527-N7)-methyltransferase
VEHRQDPDQTDADSRAPSAPSSPAGVVDAYPGGFDGLVAFAGILSTDAVTKGLIGPREVPRIWDRHILNCAVVEQAIPPSSDVLDVGSGAGLPGLVLALIRPDLQITLLEPLLRRSTFLGEAVDRLDLGDRVQVERGRAEEVRGRIEADIVVSRAVAALDVLAGWCLPLTRRGGAMLAMKGSTAAQELADAQDSIGRMGGDDGQILVVGQGLVDPPTTIVRVHRVADPAPARRR